MAKAQFGEFAAFTVKNDIRFQKTIDGKLRLVKEADIPAEVSAYLRKTLAVAKEKVEPTPTAEPVAEPVEVSEDAPALTTEDFDEPDANGNPPLPRTDEPVAVEAAAAGETPPVDVEYLETISIHTAKLEDIAQALFDRFGIYSVWLGRFPQPDEVNPFTGVPMTNYERGVAYQAAIRAEAQGVFKKDPTIHRKQLDANAEAAANVRGSYAPVAGNLKEARQHNNFDWRTSVESGHVEPKEQLEHYTDDNGELRVRRSLNGAKTRQVNDDFGSEPVSEPKLGGAPIIRPNW